MAIMTKLATMTWPSNEAQLLEAITDARIPFIQTQVTLEKTDGVATTVSPTVTTRNWLDAESAQEWATFISNAANDSGTTVNVVITDIA
jgi:hypothetical protein